MIKIYSVGSNPQAKLSNENWSQKIKPFRRYSTLKMQEIWLVEIILGSQEESEKTTNLFILKRKKNAHQWSRFSPKIPKPHFWNFLRPLDLLWFKRAESVSPIYSSLTFSIKNFDEPILWYNIPLQRTTGPIDNLSPLHY